MTKKEIKFQVLVLKSELKLEFSVILCVILTAGYSEKKYKAVCVSVAVASQDSGAFKGPYTAYFPLMNGMG